MPNMPAELFYATPAHAYVTGREVKIEAYLANGLVRVRFLDTNEVKDVRKNQVTLG